MRTLTKSELRAIDIARDELLSYVDTVGDEDGRDQVNRWAAEKLAKLLERAGYLKEGHR